MDLNNVLKRISQVEGRSPHNFIIQLFALFQKSETPTHFHLQSILFYNQVQNN